MDWNTYYEKFYDWATSTQISRMSSLTSFGASSEVAEVAQEYMDEKAASRLIKKAIAYGVQFTPDEIYDLSGCCDSSAMNELLKSAKCSFTQEQLEDLWGAADDDVLELVAKRNHVTMFADAGIEETDIEDEANFDEPKQDEPKLGFFSKLAWCLELAVFWVRRDNLTTDAIMATVRTAHRIMGIAMEDGIMVMTIRTAVSLAGTKAEVDCNLLRKHRLRNERAVLLLNELAQN